MESFDVMSAVQHASSPASRGRRIPDASRHPRAAGTTPNTWRGAADVEKAGIHGMA